MVENSEGLAIDPDVNLSILFTEMPLLARPAAAAACGFDAVELWWPFTSATPGDRELDDLSEALGEAGVRVVGLNFDAGDMAAGSRGLVSLPGEERRFRDSVDTATAWAQRVGCRAFNALYGNRIQGADHRAQDELALENLAYAAQAAARIGATILIETQNPADSPDYPLTRAAEAIAVINQVRQRTNAENVALLADLYHLHRAGEDLVATVTAYGPSIGHVQVADDPGRHQPGTGVIEFDPVFAALAGAGYGGYVGLEYRPLGRSAESFDWLPLEQRRTSARNEVAP
ncbi:MAG TPA: TIM barrel protein [Candidatus Acidoferrales bacterium]|nr:TIM barrel protein [Candidatus Acidoferrales bacterium]